LLINKIVASLRKVPLPRLSAFLLSAAAIITTLPAMSSAADLGLITAGLLKGKSPQWVILDSRPKSEWEAGHIPGAINFYWESFTRTDANGVKYSSFPPAELAVAIAKLGIDEKTPLVIYGDADTSWGSEGYTAWLFSWLGHKGPIRLLNGGFQSWRGENLPLATTAEKPFVPKIRYQVELKPQYMVSTEELVQGKGYTLIDTRSTLEWIRGKIPGAIHIPWEDFHTGKDRHPLPAVELKKLLAKNGVTTGKPVVFYCLGGVRSAYAWLTYELAGLPDGRNYKGSWAAWEKRSGR
jgi:thiosulfate/3-mercaptopyruvate sulfurtransferase